MSLITSTFFSTLVNGIPSTPFHPSTGIRQGDSLSHFLFVIMAEGLGRNIKEALHTQQLRGLSFPNTPTFTHQQFVDNIMLFFQVALRKARRIKEILNTFMEASGTKINNEQSCIFFFNTQGNVKTYLGRILGFSTGNLSSKYLGIPLSYNSLELSCR